MAQIARTMVKFSDIPTTHSSDQSLWDDDAKDIEILPCDTVARIFLENEVIYQQLPFDTFRHTRLTELLSRARADGAAEAATENERLRKALQEIADYCGAPNDDAQPYREIASNAITQPLMDKE